jgi:NitT/TauT family transport system substrate-binding protein
MSAPHADDWTRRRFLGGLTLAGTAGLLGLYPRPVAAEPPPETTTLKVLKFPAACLAPQYLAEELLRGEGFTEVQYVDRHDLIAALSAGDVHLTQVFCPWAIAAQDDGAPIVFLAGIHLGCYDLFGGDKVRTIRDLKGKTVAMTELRGGTHAFVASMAAYVGLDPAKDINFVLKGRDEARELFLAGKVDAFIAYPPDAQEFKAKKIGNLVVHSAVDRPWSQNYCCMLTGNQKFVQKNPVATKRALRAILKATDICARDPQRAAEVLLAGGYATRYDYAYQLMTELSYKAWRDYDAEDSVRFWALRLHEAGMIKLTPNKVIAQWTDWRALNQLKKELKA